MAFERTTKVKVEGTIIQMQDGRYYRQFTYVDKGKAKVKLEPIEKIFSDFHTEKVRITIETLD